MGCDYLKQNYASHFFNKLPSIHSITCQLDVTTSYDDIVANSFYSQIYITLHLPQLKMILESQFYAFPVNDKWSLETFAAY